MKTSFLLLDFFKLFLCDVYTHTRSKTIQYSFRRSDVPLLYSIRFLVIKPKLLCETLENEKEKFLFHIQIKCGNTANEILNAATDTERTFKCKWP